MKKISFLILISTLGFSLGSCSYFEAFNDKKDDLQEASKPTIKIKAKAQGTEAEAEEVKDPLAEAVEEAEGIKREEEIVGLLKSTNPEVRVRASVRGRQDPFSTVAVQPIIEIEPEKEDTRRSQDRRRSPSTNTNRNNNNRPSNITSTPTIETLETPPLVSPTLLAENVLVTGLVELSDRIRLIVQAPGETASRYVDIGQYISNGRVLIKRIESSFPTPTVILEQDGIEISRAIGQPTAEELEKQARLFPPGSVTKSISWLSKDSSLRVDDSVIK